MFEEWDSSEILMVREWGDFLGKINVVVVRIGAITIITIEIIIDNKDSVVFKDKANKDSNQEEDDKVLNNRTITSNDRFETIIMAGIVFNVREVKGSSFAVKTEIWT